MRSLEQKLKAAFVISAVALSFIGLIFVHSAGSYWGKIHYADSSPFIVKQGIYMAISFGVAYLMMKSPLLSNSTFWTYFYYIAIILLAAVLIPGIGAVRNGSQSWIALGPFSIQPAEFVKVALIGKLACSMRKPSGKNPFEIKHFVLILLPAALIMMQPDLGSAVIMIVSAFVILFIAGYPLTFFGLLGVGGVGAFIVLIASAAYRMDRIKSYIDPWSDPLGKGFQGIQSLFAIAPGGLFGHGFGNSRQKYLYLPEPQNDFIFSIIAEETGFIGATTLLILFGVLLFSAFGIAIRTKTFHAFLITSGMASMIIFQTFLNTGVVSGLLPVTGVTLPFISYGGSSLLTTWMAVGTILHFAFYREQSR
ncbi:stage V sporulation protein E [Sporosarcina sp. NCCP-2222]|uniref:putative lipid II flippase FtsW n=1 Tax=Sporosarcina TaxID=1569 RepID=UPI001EDF0F15|nr:MULTISPECIES: putative lipid II flippase FtsW [Sporosarcina]MCG3090190.1 putative lipid II flippase FtsW [Sporosarcina cyprini]GKV55677.1 stage V sporulation protein E [Sporosarcina sp. NCCP-2222]